MATDFLFVGMTFLFVQAMIFTVLAFENREFPNTAVYHFFGAITFFALSQMFLMAYASTASVLVVWMWFLGLGLVNFTLFFVWIWQAFYVLPKKKAQKELEE